MNKRKGAAIIMSLILASATGVVWATAATASSNGNSVAVRGALALTPASTQQNGAHFYDAEVLPRAWAASVAAFDEPLPDGYGLSKALPDELRELGPGQNLYQAQIVDMTIAAEYRCAWLDAGLRGLAPEDAVAEALETYWTLPSIAEFDRTGLQDDLGEVSASLGYENPNEALFDLTCNGWEK